ncbi:short chain dehydrogenase [Chitinophaga nivalis]|uniref:Short chain dehydrogenase n=1 Tax=Chitinophaga nivalis TaxID=2991709 RepID=A0ABT3IKD3_9BACT|nr:short chain dehydrogenase [Chitinophaga nivalis]MCW3465896.1 short chain dehydrogenase [Chitinophaga nivalis]MCW3484413.1 short chain dehydrogenase [Chitinophaga nivalis]
MKIIITGASGAIGKEVSAELGKRHDITGASLRNSVHQLDISSVSSIESFFEKTGPFDALVSAAGDAYWGPLQGLTEAQLRFGIENKLLGQIHLVRIGLNYIRPGGSFTLTSGVLADDPVAGSVNYAIANAGIHGFVTAAAQELPPGIRINAVSPGVTDNTIERNGPNMIGHTPVSIERVVRAYIKSVEGIINGQILRVY